MYESPRRPMKAWVALFSVRGEPGEPAVPTRSPCLTTTGKPAATRTAAAKEIRGTRGGGENGAYEQTRLAPVVPRGRRRLTSRCDHQYMPDDVFHDTNPITESEQNPLFSEG